MAGQRVTCFSDCELVGKLEGLAQGGDKHPAHRDAPYGPALSHRVVSLNVGLIKR